MKIEMVVCHCSKQCKGKGLGIQMNDCKKVTISVFQSGNVIITGARTMEQVNDAYSTINKIFKNNYSSIVRYSILDFKEENNEKVKKNKKVCKIKIKDLMSASNS